MKSFFSAVGEFIGVLLLVLLIVVPLRMFVFQPFLVRGESMQPNYQNGDYLIVDQISYQFQDPKRGEVIVFQVPFDSSQRYIKRIIGLPGETVEVRDGRVIIYDETQENHAIILEEIEYLPSDISTPGALTTTLGPDEYFVLGDNRIASADSRRWGPLPEDNIIGRVFVRVFPLEAFAKMDAPAYNE